jgi:hypothetical protein
MYRYSDVGHTVATAVGGGGLQCCLVATVIDIQSVRSQICVYMHMLCTMWRRLPGEGGGVAVSAVCLGNL